jgi:hypothetical protein
MGRNFFKHLKDTFSGKRAGRRPPSCSAFQPRLEVLETPEVPSMAPLLHVSSNGRYLGRSQSGP